VIAPSPDTAEKARSPPSPSGPLQKKLARLDPEKQRYLLRVLESLEREESFGAQAGVQASGPKISVDLGTRTASARARTLVFRALSTHGSQLYAGLNKIEVLDDKGQRVRISSGSVACDRTPVGESLSSLFSGSPVLAEDKDMFVCRLGSPSPAARSSRHSERLFQVTFTLPRGVTVTQLRVWNYNSKTRDLGIGVKDAVLLSGSKILWQGTLLRGPGNNTFDHSTTIPVPSSVGANAVAGGGGGPLSASAGDLTTRLQGPLPPLPRLKKQPATVVVEASLPIALGSTQSPRGRLSSHGRSSSEFSLIAPAPVAPVITQAQPQAQARQRHKSTSEQTQ
jgi:hypothetical protein